MFDQRFTINGKFAPELAVIFVKYYHQDETNGKKKIRNLLNKTFGEDDKFNSERFIYIEKNIKSLCRMVDDYAKGKLSLKNLPLEISSPLIKLAEQME